MFSDPVEAGAEFYPRTHVNEKSNPPAMLGRME